MEKTVVVAILLLLVCGCDNKKAEDSRPEESLLRLKQVAEQFNAKIVSNKVMDKLSYTADFQDYFSDQNQNFAFVLSVEDILKQDDTIIARFKCEFDAVVFLKMNQEMLQVVKAEKCWETFIVIASIDRIYKPFFGLNGNIDEWEIKSVDVDYKNYDKSYPVIDGSFYIEVVDAPIVLCGKCEFIEHKE